MTVWTPTIVPVGNTSLQGWLATWGSPSGMLNGDSGLPIGSPLSAAPNFSGNVQDFAGFADRSVQVTGTFGSGGNLAWEGSNDGVNYSTLRNPASTALNFTASDIQQVTEVALNARPRVTAGDGTTALIVTVFLRRTYQQPGFNI